MNRWEEEKKKIMSLKSHYPIVKDKCPSNLFPRVYKVYHEVRYFPQSFDDSLECIFCI